MITNKKKYLEIPFSLFQTLEYYPQKALPLYLMQNFKSTHTGVVSDKTLADYLVVNSEGETETEPDVDVAGRVAFALGYARSNL